MACAAPVLLGGRVGADRGGGFGAVEVTVEQHPELLRAWSAVLVAEREADEAIAGWDAGYVTTREVERTAKVAAARWERLAELAALVSDDG